MDVQIPVKLRLQLLSHNQLFNFQLDFSEENIIKGIFNACIGFVFSTVMNNTAEVLFLCQS